MKVAIGQVNVRLGDFTRNRQLLLERVREAAQNGCDIVVFPELSLFGYSPVDLLERRSVVDAQLTELGKLSEEIPNDIAVIVGAVQLNPAKFGKRYLNSAVLLRRNQRARIFSKQVLPTYDIYDESRYFAPGNLKKNFFKYKGLRIHVSICEDVWTWVDPWPGTRHPQNPFLSIGGQKVDVCINLSASPYANNKHGQRLAVGRKTARHLGASFVYVNLVGGQDEMIFDGGSFVLDSKGKLVFQAPFFEEGLYCLPIDQRAMGSRRKLSVSSPRENSVEILRGALVLGLRDFVLKNGFKHVHLGLSGGIDSALVACLAVEALGAKNVTTFALPGPHTDPQSTVSAERLARHLNCEFKVISIVDHYNSMISHLSLQLGGKLGESLHENLQARLRGVILMAVSNQSNSLLLSTGNKSEYATGYTTLYGDMCGALAPIADLLKGQVYALARSYNSTSEVIPKFILDRAPTAELRPNQTDQDTLPEYDELDRIVEKLVVFGETPKTETEEWVLSSMVKSEFKRWQAPPILRVSEHAFGRGRRFPIVNAAKV